MAAEGQFAIGSHFGVMQLVRVEVNIGVDPAVRGHYMIAEGFIGESGEYLVTARLGVIAVTPAVLQPDVALQGPGARLVLRILQKINTFLFLPTCKMSAYQCVL